MGADIGLTALLFSGIARKVHAFEPAPGTFAPANRSGGFVSDTTTLAGGRLTVDSDNRGVANLHDPVQTYTVMNLHVTRLRFSNVVAGFDALVKAAATGSLASLRPGRAGCGAERDGPARRSGIEHIGTSTKTRV